MLFKKKRQKIDNQPTPKRKCKKHKARRCEVYEVSDWSSRLFTALDSRQGDFTIKPKMPDDIDYYTYEIGFHVEDSRNALLTVARKPKPQIDNAHSTYYENPEATETWRIALYVKNYDECPNVKFNAFAVVQALLSNVEALTRLPHETKLEVVWRWH